MALDLTGGFMLGCDISHHNPNINTANLDFVVLKATEGKTYTDPHFYRNVVSVRNADNDTIIGAYHFARPDNNSPEDEAEHYLSTLKTTNERMFMALDWEGKAVELDLKSQLKWIDKFMMYCARKTDKYPFFYASSSVLEKLYPHDADFPIWVAHYGKKEPSYPNWEMWQCTSTPFDIDIFKGSYADLSEHQYRNICL